MSHAHNPAHIPVLLDDCLRVLAPRSGETYADCTAGLGGHAAAVAKLLAPGTVILNDADPANLRAASAHVAQVSPSTRIITYHGNFAELCHRLEADKTPADMTLADLGFASNHVDDAARGFSFKRDGPLDMRMNPTTGPTAAELVATLPEAELARILDEYGEERMARKIARKLAEVRRKTPISTTGQLADVVRSIVPITTGGIDPATRTFQALRIAVNDELGSLEALLLAIADAVKQIASKRATWLTPGARVAIISFHSLEDRAVKQSFAKLTKAGCEDLTNGCVTAGEAEALSNPRSRSAKLRAIRLPQG
ncbi:MAG TPA: 16S rRNA (cytosine(1402)-N(4))-methyltransferase RsmH [Phycisphaerales bacterium]|nr:16S rRNA (cytosine(1402)-N(4))-methyltransferase RsmH [Phycisphaerales bacterium]